MNVKSMYLSSIILFIISVVLLFGGAFARNTLFMVVACLGALLGFVLLSGAKTYREFWKCDKCKKTQSITPWRYVISENGRRHQKKLKCPNCEKATWHTRA